MIHLDPAKRPTAQECLKQWNKTFPKCFSKLLYHIGASFLRVSFLYSDNKVCLIRHHIQAIYDMCIDAPLPPMTEHPEPAIQSLI
jgi:hypothetical protein